MKKVCRKNELLAFLSLKGRELSNYLQKGLIYFDLIHLLFRLTETGSVNLDSKFWRFPKLNIQI